MHPTLIKIRLTVSRYLLVIAALLLVWCIVALVITWTTAASEGVIPQQWDKEGNHGPWHYDSSIRGMVMNAIFSPFFAGFFSLLSFAVKPSRIAGVFFGISVVTYVLLSYTHFWLID
jgi:hypothetical protein